MSVRFEWESEKAASNHNKHGVAFEEAASVFSDPLAVIFDDEKHSLYELRELIIGHSIDDRLLIVSFTERQDAIRIISARICTRREIRDYEENTAMKEPVPEYITENDEMPDEFQFDYSKAKPNRFAGELEGCTVMVALEPEVAESFRTADAVNKALRSLIKAKAS
ncbi:MAG: BrnT family toxin [Caldilineales bacterium]|nr:BrnT family toxin [Caldilineales bacterium]